MKNRIITISRQFGSGGRVIGEEIAKRLGIPCYDQELIKMFAGESGFSEDYIKESSEHAMHGNIFSSIFSDRVYDTPITQDVLWEAQRKVILDLAQKGSCVIVGRCADYILADEADLLKVFIHADMDKRIERIERIYGETEKASVKRINDNDKRRRAYHQKYAEGNWGQAENYHICLDSGIFGIDKCVDIIADLY